ncbi:hypothetical protein D3C85_1518780 [compost metagenome]
MCSVVTQAVAGDPQLEYQAFHDIHVDHVLFVDYVQRLTDVDTQSVAVPGFWMIHSAGRQRKLTCQGIGHQQADNLAAVSELYFTTVQSSLESSGDRFNL